MADVKYRIEGYDFYDTEGIARQLEKMAADGWMIESINGIFYKYRRCEKQDVAFAATYFVKNNDFDTYPTPQQQQYIDICRQAGWQPVLFSRQLQVFMNPDPDAVPVETDAVLQLENIHAMAKKGWLINNFIFIGLGILNLFTSVGRIKLDVVEFLSSPVHIIGILFWLFYTVAMVLAVVRYYSWYSKAKKQAEETGVYLPPKAKGVNIYAMLLIVMALWLAYMMSAAAGGQGRYLLRAFMAVGLGLFIMKIVVGEARRMGKTGKELETLAVITLVVATLVGISLAGRMMMPAILHEETEDGTFITYEGVEEYHPDILVETGRVVTPYEEYFPLKIGDIYDGFITPSRFIYDVEGGNWIRLLRTRQIAEGASLYVYIYYPSRWAYSLVEWRETTSLPDNWHYEEADPQPWNADKVYVMRDETGNHLGRMIVCWPDKIVALTLPVHSDLTDRQIVTITGKLQNYQPVMTY